MDKYFYPIPKEKLIARFEPVIEQLSKSKNATLLALPFAGRSSHLRFITAKKVFDIPDQLVWVETELCKNFVDLCLEICLSIEPNNMGNPVLVSRDEYLVKSKVEEIINNSKNSIILILSFGRISIELFKEAEYQIALIQKRCPNLKVLWSLDTNAYRNYHPIHASCIASESIFFFPTFDAIETTHSIKRIALLKGKNISKELFDLSGGIAGLFHGLVSEGEKYLVKPQAEEIMKIISQELTLSPELSLCLSTPSLRELLTGTNTEVYWFENIKLKKLPSAQEVAILKILIQNLNKYTARDEIAERIWGKPWQVKYSNWAIDKAISRLRQNINSKLHRLITVKGVGYSLLCPLN